jgi:radical SAM superfamily enzyme YgiQ (UPF0313 family)
MSRHPLGTRARVLLSSVFGPYAQDDQFGSRAINPMELYQNQVTREQGPFSLRMFHRSWGIALIQHNITAPTTVLDFPTRARFVEELTRHRYDIVGISSIIVNAGKVREMCRLVRDHSAHSTIVVGGHVTALPDIEQRVDADHYVKGEGISWFREFLGEDPARPIAHPALPSAFDFRIMGLPTAGGGSTTAATIIPSVGCPLGCNFCTTSAFFGGKGRSVSFLPRGRDVYDAMAHAEAELGATTFFMMDENFLLDRRRAIELLDLLRANGKPWSMYVFSSANAIAKYDIRELVELGVSWIWLGLESAASRYAKLAGTDTRELTARLQEHGIRVLGSTIIGLEHHTPENIAEEIEHAVSHDTDFHQFMLYTPVPGTELHREISAAGRLRDEVDLADIHGQFEFNFEHAAIPAADSKRFLDHAFRRDYERNGPSLFRLMRTMFRGWQRYRDDPDPRVRARVARDASQFKAGYGAALYAMERFFRDGNVEVSRKVRALRRDVEREFGLACRVVDRAVGPAVLWSARREARRFPAGRPLEPRTFVERRNWASV